MASLQRPLPANRVAAPKFRVGKSLSSSLRINLMEVIFVTSIRYFRNISTYRLLVLTGSRLIVIYVIANYFRCFFTGVYSQYSVHFLPSFSGITTYDCHIGFAGATNRQHVFLRKHFLLLHFAISVIVVPRKKGKRTLYVAQWRG